MTPKDIQNCYNKKSIIFRCYYLLEEYTDKVYLRIFVYNYTKIVVSIL